MTREYNTMMKLAPKAARELFVGNLALHEVTEEVLRDKLRELLFSLPDYEAAYPGMPEPICSLEMRRNGTRGLFAFVEFLDDTIASTVQKLNGVELKGRPMRIGRPKHQLYDTAAMAPPSLDITPLRALGILPSDQELAVFSSAQLDDKLKELYIGNLKVGAFDEKQLIDFLEPVCLQLEEYNPHRGPPITSVVFGPNGKFCFVRVQNIHMPAKLVPVLDKMELFGRKLNVGLPKGVEGKQVDELSEEWTGRRLAPADDAFSAGAKAAAFMTV